MNIDDIARVNNLNHELNKWVNGYRNLNQQGHMVTVKFADQKLPTDVKWVAVHAMKVYYIDLIQDTVNRLMAYNVDLSPPKPEIEEEEEP